MAADFALGNSSAFATGSMLWVICQHCSDSTGLGEVAACMPASPPELQLVQCAMLGIGAMKRRLGGAILGAVGLGAGGGGCGAVSCSAALLIYAMEFAHDACVTVHSSQGRGPGWEADQVRPRAHAASHM